ncbi:hypothetical protein [Marinilabilia salmonicolor]|uniref:hypothetical protein n=1 Tax=Marinilabilia salmonicolor TaxID=989 RepID=UPI00029AC699|nr:hypothetical protein [Marinilabilia salmonicolor]
MKNILLLFFISINILANAQDLPTEPANGFAFPLGSKFTIMLHPIDSTSFDYSIIEFTPFQDIIDTWENDSIFDEQGQKGTIEFIFCLSTSGDTESEKEENMKVLLLMQNRTDFSLSYKSDIQTDEDGDFQETSNVGTFSGAKGTEIWPYMIHQIGLHGFKKME